MDAINDITQKVCGHTTKMWGAGVRGGGGQKRSENGTFSNFELNLHKTEQQNPKINPKNGFSGSKLTKIDMREEKNRWTTLFCNTV